MAHVLPARPEFKLEALATSALGRYLLSVWRRGPVPHWSEYLRETRN